MIASTVTHRMGMNVRASGDTGSPIIGPGGRYLPAVPSAAVYPPPINRTQAALQAAGSPLATVYAPLVKSPQTEIPAASVPASSSVASAPAATASSSGSGTSSGSLPVLVSGMVDPVTGITYSGYLTPDAQTLYQNGSLVSGGNQLTPQGSALAAQGDLITGTPAPTTSEVATASAISSQPASPFDSWAAFTGWLSSETLWPGVPNGLLVAGGGFGLALLFGGKKGRR